MLLSIFVILLFSCIGVDIAHFVSANIELQNAADACAMAGCYELSWVSTGAQVTAATNAAQTMGTKCYADLYSPAGVAIPTAFVNVTIFSSNGGTDNTIRCNVNPPIGFLIAPFMIGAQGGSIAGATATAEQLPILSVPAPPWFMNTDASIQDGPSGCTVAKNGYDSGVAPFVPIDGPPTTFPSTKYVTFIDDQPCKSNSVLPTQWPTYWVYYGISNLANVQPNPPGIAAAIKCLGICTQTSGTCTKVNPVVINGSQMASNHGSMSSAVSNPESMSQPKNTTETGWSGNPDGSSVNTVLPITDSANNVIGVYAVKLYEDMVPNTYKNGQGVYGEFKVEFLSNANTVPGVTVFAPTNGVFNNVGSTVAQLIK